MNTIVYTSSRDADPLSFLRFHGKIYDTNIPPSRKNDCFYVFISALSRMEVGRFEFNERPRRPIFPRFSYPVELRVSAQLCFNCTAIINYGPPPPRRKYSYRCSRVNKGRITLPPRVADAILGGSLRTWPSFSKMIPLRNIYDFFL